jgi:peroxiredoxin
MKELQGSNRWMALQRVLAMTLAAALAAGAAAQEARPLPLGERAPSAEVKMKGVDGKSLSIADAAGAKGTLVLFTCNACPWVKAWEDRIAELGNRYRERGVGVIAVNPNDPRAVAEDGYEEMQRRAKEKGFRFPYVVDATSEVAAAFGATRTPEAFLFDAQGRLVYHGTIDDNAKQPEKVEARYLRDALEAVVAGKTPAVQETKALGCTIKFRGKA